MVEKVDQEGLPCWTPDEFGTLMLHFVGPHGPVEAWIGPRPAYCDRGHWQFCPSYGVPDIDGQDSFPRYYMSLYTAIQEASMWLNWRLYKQRVSTPGPITQSRLDEDDLPEFLVFRPAGKFTLSDKEK